MAKITDEEKEGIINLYKAGTSPHAITSIVKRSSTAVNKVIGDYVAANPSEEVEKQPSPNAGRNFVSKKIIEDTVFKLYSGGMDEKTARQAVESVIPSLKETIRSIDDLYRIVIKLADISNVTVNKSTSGREGVSIMTEAGSAKIDMVKENYVAPQREDCIFRPRG